LHQEKDRGAEYEYVDYDMSFQDTSAAVARSTRDGKQRGGGHGGMEVQSSEWMVTSTCCGNVLMRHVSKTLFRGKREFLVAVRHWRKSE
jgi:hypothetical protein